MVSKIEIKDGLYQIRKRSQGFMCRACQSDGGVYGYNGWAYVEQHYNYSVLCPECWRELKEYVREVWSNYYSSVF